MILLGSILAGVLGRLGGKEGFNTKYRDIGVSAIIVISCVLYGQIKGIPAWLSLLPCLGLMFGALTSYRYFLPKPKDYQWYHYSLHGFMVSLALFPLMFFAGNWLGFWLRCGINTLLVGLWSMWISWDDLEEFGRYFIITMTLWFVFWGGKIG